MNCSHGRSECPQAWKSLCTGWVPRGFSPCKSSETRILVVGKNPGHPLEGETPYYKNKKGEALLAAKEKWGIEWRKRVKDTNDNSLKFHKNLRRYLRYFLGLSAKLETYHEYVQGYSIKHEKEIDKFVAFTNIFKCSTECEQERIKYDSFNICYTKFFIQEVQLIKPQLILALGNEVTNFLKSKPLQMPVVSIRHPSYFYERISERDKLNQKKKEINKILK